MISASSSASGNSTEDWLKKILSGDAYRTLSRFGQMGVSALAAATPVDSGETANSWYYEVVRDGHSWSMIWGNHHVEEGRPIAVLLEYGHGTRTGGYVAARPYINAALQPIFDQMEAENWRVVTA